MKKILLGICALVLTFPLTTYAAEQQKEVVVSGGNLAFNQAQLNFTDITLASTKSNQTSKATTKVKAVDSRGNGSGWTYSVSATDFVTTMGEEQFTLPISTVKYSATVVDTISGVPLDFTSGGEIAQNKVLSNQPGVVLSVEPGKGQGAYEFEVAYNLTLPKTIRNTQGKEIGVVAGKYQSVFTYTATSGI
ncbi:WxL domain-containing protein [Paenibacillus gallinarum]|uniref:WxL domain-containing protein n=1 Tax=Paenibacillus gallinarum TaxID=2762232 RepID=A0ABR8T3B7_9BACL|nr:WxL domain-containing protein [Paenibacillus gallinarum]MBD7970276.1 WxL domain-containing protein [Paenibacillus gallinarum]